MFGPTFGGGHDLYIKDNANVRTGSCSNLGTTYRHPRYAKGSVDVKAFLAGTSHFKIDEIEVYRVEFNA